MSFKQVRESCCHSTRRLILIGVCSERHLRNADEAQPKNFAPCATSTHEHVNTSQPMLLQPPVQTRPGQAKFGGSLGDVAVVFLQHFPDEQLFHFFQVVGVQV